MDINSFFQSKYFKGAIGGIAAFILLLAVFKTGVIIGSKKADFSCRWSNNYHRNFGGPRGGFLKGFGDRDFIEANGTVGQIIKIEGDTLIIRGQNEVEKIIIVKNDTTIKDRQKTIELSGLKVNDFIITIGEPNQNGQIEAKLIRLMPPKK